MSEKMPTIELKSNLLSIKERKRKSSHMSMPVGDSKTNVSSIENIPRRTKTKKTNSEPVNSDKSTTSTVYVESSNRESNNASEALTVKTKKKKKKNNQVTAPNSQLQLASSCVEYLNQWKNDRNNWKFVKVKQIRLISNMLDKETLPDEMFTIFIEYISGGSESLKKLVTAKANEVIAEMEKWQNLNDEEKLTTPKMDETKYLRARSLLQNID